MTKENNNLYAKIEKLQFENTEISNDFNNLNKELLKANKIIKELQEEKIRTTTSTISGGYKENINNINNNAIKFPNNKSAGLNNIKNIDESEMNESEYHLNSSKKDYNNYNNKIIENQDFRRNNFLNERELNSNKNMNKYELNNNNFNNANKQYDIENRENNSNNFSNKNDIKMNRAISKENEAKSINESRSNSQVIKIII